MGINTFFAATMVQSGGSWENALGLSFISSLLHFLFVSLFYATNSTGILLFTSPHHLRVGVILGIGFLLAFVGLKEQSGIGLFYTNAEGLFFPVQELKYNFFLACAGLILLAFLHKVLLAIFSPFCLLSRA